MASNGGKKKTSQTGGIIPHPDNPNIFATKIISATDLFRALQAVGVFSKEEKMVVRFIIDASVDSYVKLYVQRVGDSNLLEGLPALLEGIQEEKPKKGLEGQLLAGVNLLEARPDLKVLTNPDSSLTIKMGDSETKYIPEHDFASNLRAVYIPDETLENLPALFVIQGAQIGPEVFTVTRRVESLTECYEILEDKE